MKLPVSIVASLALVGGALCTVHAASSDYMPSTDKSAADNSAKNVRDRGGETRTPMDQSNKPEDIDLTKRIRQAVEADSGLSTDAKNVKIITVDGVVWLRGPVKTAHEKKVIAKEANKIAGAHNVRNQMEIAREAKSD
jgi:osmotically-inducible protein OsmY